MALVVKNPPADAGGLGPWVEKIPWKRAWQPTPVFTPGESHGQRGLAGYSSQGHQKSNTSEVSQHSCVKQTSNTNLPHSVGLSSVAWGDVKETQK